MFSSIYFVWAPMRHDCWLAEHVHFHETALFSFVYRMHWALPFVLSKWIHGILLARETFPISDHHQIYKWHQFDTSEYLCLNGWQIAVFQCVRTEKKRFNVDKLLFDFQFALKSAVWSKFEMKFVSRTLFTMVFRSYSIAWIIWLKLDDISKYFQMNLINNYFSQLENVFLLLENPSQTMNHH